MEVPYVDIRPGALNTMRGSYTYVGIPSHVDADVTIGRYCSIGRFCSIGAQPHDMTGLTTYPRRRDLPRVATTIGHDVWIGDHVVVLAGVTIGTGAVIGAGAVVTRDVLPYAVAYGSPSRMVKRRFGQHAITELLKSEWWTLPLDIVETLPPVSDLLACLAAIKEAKR